MKKIFIIGLILLLSTNVYAIRKTTNITDLLPEVQERIAVQNKKNQAREDIGNTNVPAITSIPQIREAIKMILDYLELEYQE